MNEKVFDDNGIQVYHGDCLDVMKELDDESVDCVATDPPYLINYKTGHRKNKEHEFCSSIQGDDDPELITKVMGVLYNKMKIDTAMYMFCSFDNVEFFKKEISKKFKIKNMIIWVKNNWTAGDLEAQFGKKYELLFLANKGRRKINGKRITDVWYFNRISGDSQLHQNEKPVGLIGQCIDKHSFEGQCILDPFAGSGTTGVAAYRLKRKCILIEKEEKYVDIIIKRLKNEMKQVRLFT